MANNSNPKVMVSSFTTGNRATETTSFRTVGDALTEGGISTTECVLELTGSDGTAKTCNVNSVLADGDFLSIMKKSNKSG